jgi:hypothetical protein
LHAKDTFVKFNIGSTFIVEHTFYQRCHFRATEVKQWLQIKKIRHLTQSTSVPRANTTRTAQTQERMSHLNDIAQCFLIDINKCGIECRNNFAEVGRLDWLLDLVFMPMQKQNVKARAV